MPAHAKPAALALAAAANALAANPGDLLWRYPIAADYLSNEVTVAPDGTIYASDYLGNLYAINPDGTEKWTVDALRGQIGAADEGPVAVFADGTVLVAVNPLGAETELVAYDADGSFKWVRTFTDSISWFAGPTIGPDGHAYAAQSGPTADEQVIRIDAAGTIDWTARGTPDLFEENTVGGAIRFVRDGSRDLLGFHSDQNTNGRLFVFETDSGNQQWANPVSAINAPFMQHLQLQVESDYDAGRFYMTAFGWGSAAWGMRAFDADGSVAWTYDPRIAAQATAPAVGPDGTIYLAWDLQFIGAVSPSGTELWQIFDDTPVREQPTVSPDGSLLVCIGQQNGVSGRIEAFDTADGSSVWNTPLTLPEVGTVYPSGRAVFSPDGSSVYVGSSVFSGFIDGSFLYAFAAGTADTGCNPADLAAPFGQLTFADISAFLAAFTGQDPAADLAAPAGQWTFADISAFLAAFSAGCP